MHLIHPNSLPAFMYWLLSGITGSVCKEKLQHYCYWTAEDWPFHEFTGCRQTTGVISTTLGGPEQEHNVKHSSLKESTVTLPIHTSHIQKGKTEASHRSCRAVWNIQPVCLQHLQVEPPGTRNTPTTTKALVLTAILWKGQSQHPPLSINLSTCPFRPAQTGFLRDSSTLCKSSQTDNCSAAVRRPDLFHRL